jgi:hypothetical protein
MHHHRHHGSPLMNIGAILFLQRLLRDERGQAPRERNNPPGISVWQFLRQATRLRRRLAILGMVSIAPLATVIALSGEMDPGLGVLLFLAATVLMVIIFLSVSMFWLFEALRRRGY